MIRIIFFGLFLSAKAYIDYPAVEPWNQDGLSYFPLEPELDSEQLKNYEEQALAQDFPIVYEEELRIPGEKPNTSESYLCTAFNQLNEKSISKSFSTY